MPYSKEDAINTYNALLKKAQGMRDWTTFIQNIAEGWVLSKPNFNNELLGNMENQLGVKLPLELKQLYAETDGIQDTTLCPVVLPARELVPKNLLMRTNEDFKELFMPFDHLLFFGEAGNGDLYAYPIKMNGRIDTIEIFAWDHENDNRKWIARDIRDLILRLLARVMSE